MLFPMNLERGALTPTQVAEADAGRLAVAETTNNPFVVLYDPAHWRAVGEPRGEHYLPADGNLTTGYDGDVELAPVSADARELVALVKDREEAAWQLKEPPAVPPGVYPGAEVTRTEYQRAFYQI